MLQTDAYYISAKNIEEHLDLLKRLHQLQIRTLYVVGCADDADIRDKVLRKLEELSITNATMVFRIETLHVTDENLALCGSMRFDVSYLPNYPNKTYRVCPRLHHSTFQSRETEQIERESESIPYFVIDEVNILVDSCCEQVPEQCEQLPKALEEHIKSHFKVLKKVHIGEIIINL